MSSCENILLLPTEIFQYIQTHLSWLDIYVLGQTCRTAKHACISLRAYMRAEIRRQLAARANPRDDVESVAKMLENLLEDGNSLCGGFLQACLHREYWNNMQDVDIFVCHTPSWWDTKEEIAPRMKYEICSSRKLRIFGSLYLNLLTTPDVECVQAHPGGVCPAARALVTEFDFSFLRCAYRSSGTGCHLWARSFSHLFNRTACGLFVINCETHGWDPTNVINFEGVFIRPKKTTDNRIAKYLNRGFSIAVRGDGTCSNKDCICGAKYKRTRSWCKTCT